jgi:hypothetical protein
MALHSPYVPKGRRPGPQRRRERSWLRRLRRAVIILLGVAVTWAAVIGVLDEYDPSFGLRWFATDNGWWFYGSGVLAFLVGMGLVAFWEVDLTSHRWDQNLVIDPVELSRGETVRARLKHEIPDCRPGSLEVGLVCREFYDTRVDAYGREGSPLAQRMTIDAVAYEEWQAGHDRSRPYSFTVPVDAPYSYEGECLSFAWAVTTRYRTGDDLPVERIRPLWVRP